jgi:hypothetical protein
VSKEIELRPSLSDRLHGLIAWLGGVFYGMFFYDAVVMFRRQQADLEHLFVLISFGDLLGVPILPPYYNLRLLPYVTPLIQNWRRRMLREKDLTDLVS